MTQIEILIRELGLKQDKLAVMEQTVRQLEEIVNGYEATLEQQACDKGQLKNEVAQLKSKLKAADDQYVDLRGEAESLKADNASLRRNIEALDNEIVSMRHQRVFVMSDNRERYLVGVFTGNTHSILSLIPKGFENRFSFSQFSLDEVCSWPDDVAKVLKERGDL